MAVFENLDSLGFLGRSNFSLWLCSTITLLVAACALCLKSSRPSPDIPLLGFDEKDVQKRKQKYTFGARHLLGEGYEKFKETIFGVDTAHGLKLVLPYSYVEEIANHPDLSFHKSLDEDLLVDYTYMGGVGHVPLSILKKDVVANLGQFIPDFNALIEEYVPKQLGYSQDWTPMNLYLIILRTLAILTARVMISPTAPHDETWVTLTMNYVQSATQCAHTLKGWHWLLRPIICRFLPSYVAVRRQLNDGRGMILKTIKEQDEREEKNISEHKPTSVLYGMSRKLEHKTPKAIEWHLQEQMNLAVGGIHTTSAVLTQTLFELAAHPEYIEPLRKEVLEAVDKCDGALNKATLWEMHKLDSFIRETHRLNSPNLTTLQRMAVRPTKLSNGMYLPRGTKLELPTFAIHRDEGFYENAATFDGFRFLHYLGWGIGRAACPGRFLADVEIKLIVSHAHVDFENQVWPNPVDPVLFKRINSDDLGRSGGIDV